MCGYHHKYIYLIRSYSQGICFPAFFGKKLFVWAQSLQCGDFEHQNIGWQNIEIESLNVEGFFSFSFFAGTEDFCTESAFSTNFHPPRRQGPFRPCSLTFFRFKLPDSFRINLTYVPPLDVVFQEQLGVKDVQVHNTFWATQRESILCSSDRTAQSQQPYAVFSIAAN